MSDEHLGLELRLGLEFFTNVYVTGVDEGDKHKKVPIEPLLKKFKFHLKCLSESRNFVNIKKGDSKNHNILL